MTTTHPPITLTDAALDQLCDHIADCDDCFDSLLDGFDRLSALLSPISLAALCEAFEICPIHGTDIDTCRDDELNCQEG